MKFLTILLFVTTATSFADSAIGSEKSCAAEYQALSTQLLSNTSDIDLANPEILKLSASPVDKTVLRRVKDDAAKISYVVDDQDQIYAVEGELAFTDNKKLRVVIMKDADGRTITFPVKASGTIKYDPAKKSFSFPPDYSLDLSEAEQKDIQAKLKAANPDVEFSEAPKNSNTLSKVFNCSDILNSQLAAKSYELDRVVIRNVANLSMLGLKDLDLRRKYKNDPEKLAEAQEKLFVVFGVDTAKRTETTLVGGVVGRVLVEKNAGPKVDYVTRLGTGFASNYAAKLGTDTVTHILNDGKKSKNGDGLTPQVTQEIMMYSNGTNFIYPPIFRYFDKRVLDTAPMNYFDACRNGGKFKFLVSPRMMRVEEAGVQIIINLPKYFLWGV